MQLKETVTIENPFKNTGKLWIIFSALGLIGGVILLLMTKGDFQNLRPSLTSQDGQQIVPAGKFLLKLFSGLTLLGLGVKYLRVSLSALFKYDPDKKLTENLAKEVQEERNQRYYVYNAGSLFKILQSKILELIKPTTLIENITTRIFTGLKNLPPRYFNVSQNFLNAVVSSTAPFLILLVALFLNYLEIIDIFSGNRFEWIMLLISVSVLFSWSPFSPLTDNEKINHKAIILSLCSIGTLVIVRTTYVNYELPEIPGSVFLVAFIFTVLSGGIFYAFFFLLKRRIEIEGTNDSITVLKEDFDLDIHPDEIHRIVSRRMIDLGNSNLINRIYHDQYTADQGAFKMTMMHETQPIPRYTIKDSILTHSANRLSQVGFIGASVGLILLLILTGISTTFVGLLLSTVATLGIINFGLKLIHLSNLFLSEFLFESTLTTVVGNGEYKYSQVTAGRGIHDNVESKNEVTRASISLQLASTQIVSVSFMQIGQSNPFEHTPRYIVSLDKDDETVAYLTKSLAEHISGKSQIAGISNSRDTDNIKNLSNLTKPPVKETNLLDNDIDDLEINDN